MQRREMLCNLACGRLFSAVIPKGKTKRHKNNLHSRIRTLNRSATRAFKSVLCDYSRAQCLFHFPTSCSRPQHWPRALCFLGNRHRVRGMPVSEKPKVVLWSESPLLLKGQFLKTRHLIFRLLSHAKLLYFGAEIRLKAEIFTIRKGILWSIFRATLACSCLRKGNLFFVFS